MKQLQEVNIRNYKHLKNETLQSTEEKPPSSFILSCVESLLRPGGDYSIKTTIL